MTAYPEARELRFAEEAVRAAGALLRERRAAAGEMSAETKNGDHRDLVCECDRAVEDLIRTRLADAYPGDPLLSEESEAPALEAGARAWILDPVDGTVNFLRRGRDYAVSLALWEGGAPRAGAVYDPAGDALYGCLPGSGAFANGVPVRRAPKAAVPRGADPLNGALLDASLNTIAAFIRRGVDVESLSRRVQGHRSLACASLAIVRVALGELDFFASDKLRPWDWAAAAAFLEETGGCSRGLFGRTPAPLDPSPVPFLAAASPELADELIRALATVSDR